MEYICYYENCKRAFNSKYNLVRHVNTRHLKIKRYVCQQCEKRFQSKQNLQSHQSVHNRPSIVFSGVSLPHLSTFRLSDHYQDHKIIYELPSNSSPPPELPKIDPERQAPRKLIVTSDLIIEEED